MGFQDEILDANAKRKLNLGDNLSKGHKGGGAAIGTIKNMGGRPYIKTAQGWKYHGSGGGKKAQAHSQSTSNVQDDLHAQMDHLEQANYLREIENKIDSIEGPKSIMDRHSGDIAKITQLRSGDYNLQYDYKKQIVTLKELANLIDSVDDIFATNPLSSTGSDDGSTTNLARVTAQHQKNVEAFNANPNATTLAAVNDSGRFLGHPEVQLPTPQPIQSPSHKYLAEQRAKLQAQIAHMDSYEQWYGNNAQKVQSFIEKDLAPALKSVGLTLDSAKIQEPYNEHASYTSEKRMIIDAHATLHKGSLYERYQDRGAEKRAKERIAKMAGKFKELTGHILDISHYAFDKENLGQPGHITIKFNL